jgi:hypothetical protein
MISKYTGDLRKSSKRSRTNEGRFQGGYEGSKEVLSRRKQNNFYSRRSKKVGNYQGPIKPLTPKQQQQAIEGKSLNSTIYEGNLKVLAKKRQERFMTRDSKLR